MRVFWISATDIGSDAYGGAVYSACILRAFQAVRPDWDIEVFAPSPEERPTSDNAHRLRQVQSLLRAAIGGPPAKVRFSCYPRVQKRIQDAMHAKAPDLVILDGPDVYEMVSDCIGKCPYFVVVHNLEGQTFTQSLEFLSPSARLAFSCMGEPERYANYEMQVLQKAAGFIHISGQDMQKFAKTRPAVQILPYFPEPDRTAQKPSDKIRLGYLGKLTWWQNKRGLEWFLQEIWPHAASNIELHLWGKGSAAFDNPQARIFGHGFAQDLSEVWSTSDIMLVPAVSSGGVNVKLCESLANAKPVMATPLALRGLPEISDTGVILCETLNDWQTALSENVATQIMAQPVSPHTRRLFSASYAHAALDGFLKNQGL